MCCRCPQALSIIQFCNIIIFVLYFFCKFCFKKTHRFCSGTVYSISTPESSFWIKTFLTQKNLQKQKSIFAFFLPKNKLDSYLTWCESGQQWVQCIITVIAPATAYWVKTSICLGWLTEMASTSFFNNLVQKWGTRPLPQTVSSPPIPTRVGWSHCGVLSSKYTTSTKAGVQLHVK